MDQQSCFWMRLRQAPRRYCTALLLSLIIAANCAAAQTSGVTQRPLTVEDMFALEGLGRYFGGPYSVSPDGQALAFVRVRADNDMTDFSHQFLWGNQGADVWVQQQPGAKPIKLTDGDRDGTGWWAPQWSPDGRYLAMLSTRGGNLTLWVQDIRLHQLRQLTQRGVDIGDIERSVYHWLDAQNILIQLLPEGEQPTMMKIDTETPSIATAGWKKQVAGKEVTSSILESAGPSGLEQKPRGDLASVNAADGTFRSVTAEKATNSQPSPDGHFIAYARQTSIYRPENGEQLALSSYEDDRYSVAVRSIAGKPVGEIDQYSRDVLPESLRWSPDGKQLAFLGYAGARDKGPDIFKVDTGTGAVTQINLHGLDAAPIVREAPQLAWTSRGSMILLAAKFSGGSRPDVEERRDWWLIDAAGGQKCLTSSLAKAPGEVLALASHDAFVGLAEGKLWKITADDSPANLLHSEPADKITQLVWPKTVDLYGDSQVQPVNAVYHNLIFATGQDPNRSLYIADLDSGGFHSIPKPAAAASLRLFDPVRGTLVFASEDRNGLWMWRGSLQSQASEELLKANTFLSQVASGAFQSIEYTSLDGAKLKAWVMLPYGYQKGHRYPLLTWVYAGSVAHETPSQFFQINQKSPLNLQIAAAHGYAVLLPSMPLNPEGKVDDPMLRLMNGVLPAVDKTIDLGIADPDRLFVMGQSFGGFSTYGLVTQTHRFKAAVSLAGLSDLISLYGVFDARERYGAHPEQDLFMEALMESAQVHMGVPPWQDLGRYIRNSPIFFVDRVQTPLLIIQGDLDYVAMQQGEEFFRALYRQGKRARFVRYWGEDHVLSSPANIRDMWRQIFDWLDNPDFNSAPAKDASPLHE